MKSLISLTCLILSVSSCPDGWISAGGSCYFMSPEKMNFLTAQEFCWEQGSYLAEVTSAAEQEALGLFLLNGADFWLGLSDAEQEGMFIWQESRQEADYTNWYSNQPDGKTGENCVLIKSGAHQANYWYDLPCSAVGEQTASIHALCEMAM